jgi:hypothetical protein
MLFRLTSLLQHPFPDVSRTVQDRDACRLTRIEKTNAFEIDEIQFLQIQNSWRFAALDFGFDLIQVPKSKFGGGRFRCNVSCPRSANLAFVSTATIFHGLKMRSQESLSSVANS